MKKLMIVACALTLAAVANAATFSWAVDGVAAYNGVGSSDGYQAWLIQNYTGTISADNIATVISTYGAADDWGGIDGGATDGSSSSWGANQTVNAQVLIIDGSSVGSAEHFYLTASQTAVSNGMAVFTPASLSFDASATASAGSWSTLSVPEPTSGLLLLLGVAGLALKRKRA